MNINIKPFSVIEKIFGTDISIKKRNISDFPFVYSKNFQIFDVTGVIDFTYIISTGKEVLIEFIKGIYQKCQDEFNKKAIIYLDETLIAYKQVCLNSHINYVSSDYDHHLFNNDSLKDKIGFVNEGLANSYTKNTQLVANFYLSNEIQKYSVREISEKLNISYSSVCRANAFLFEISAVNKTGIDNMAKYIIKSKKDLLEKIKPFFISPIKEKKLVVIDKIKLEKINGYKSGDSALSKYTLLEDNDSIIELAFNHDDYAAIEKLSNKQEGDFFFYLEDFIYDPVCFSNDRTISLLDTYIIAYKRYRGKSNDERIKKALSIMERKIIYEQ